MRAARLGLVGAAFLGVSGAPGSAEPIKIGGPFELIAADGSVVTDAAFRGDWLLILFGYTFCPDFCPTALSVVADALDRLGDDAERVQAIFITIDPERDTPEVMGGYVAAFDERIVGLTGDAERIAAVADAYGAYYKAHRSDPSDLYYVVDHSTYLYIVDPDGEFDQVLRFDASSEDIVAALRKEMRAR